MSRLASRRAAGAGLAALLAIILVAGRFGGCGIALPQELTKTVAAAGSGPLGWLMFAAAQMAVAMIGIIPASLLGIAAGTAYGIGLGFLLSASGTMIGGCLAFLLARSLLRDWVAARMAQRTARIRFEAAIAQDGWRLVCLLRVSPVMPFAATSYMLGLTNIGLRDYIVGTLAALPALFGYVTLGALAGMGLDTLSAETVGLRVVPLALGLVATLALTLRLGRLLRMSGMLPARG